MDLERTKEALKPALFVFSTVGLYIVLAAILNSVNGYEKVITIGTLERAVLAGSAAGLSDLLLN